VSADVDLAPVAAADVAAAVDRAGRGNPLLGVSTGPGTGLPAAQLADPAGGADRRAKAAQLIDAVGAWLRTGEPRVAASMVVLGYAARLVGPTLAVLLREGILIDARPSRVVYSYAPDQGFRLTVPQPAGWRGPPEPLRRRWRRDIIDGHLRQLVDAVRESMPVAAGLLWGNVASGVAGALRAVAQSEAAPLDACLATGLDVLAHGPLRGSGHLSVHGGQLRFVRRSCCLYYRLDGGGMCADCALLPSP